MGNRVKIMSSIYEKIHIVNSDLVPDSVLSGYYVSLKEENKLKAFRIGITIFNSSRSKGPLREPKV